MSKALLSHPRVQYADPNGAGGYVVYLAWGYCWGDEGEHVRGFDTVAEALEEINSMSDTCKCQECVRELAEENYE